MKLLDYIYYRIFLFCRDINSQPSAETAALILAVLQCAVIYDVDLLSKLFFNRFILENGVLQNLALGAILLIVNILLYRKRRREKLIARWSNEAEDDTKWRGMVIVLCIAVLIGFPFISMAKLGPAVEWNSER